MNDVDKPRQLNFLSSTTISALSACISDLTAIIGNCGIEVIKSEHEQIVILRDCRPQLAPHRALAARRAANYKFVTFVPHPSERPAGWSLLNVEAAWVAARIT